MTRNIEPRPETGPGSAGADDGAAARCPAAPASGAGSFEQITRLHELLEAATLDRHRADLAATLERIAHAVCDTLGLRVIVVNLYRRAWDDFVAATVVGPPEVRAELAGATYTRESWDVLLDPRFLRRGAYVIRNGEFDWEGFEGKRIALPEAGTDDPAAWHPEDEIFIPFHDAAGRLLGIFCVGDPVSGRWPSDAALDALVAVAKHAAWAVLAAQEAAAARSHRDALEQLLRVSAQLTEDLDLDRVLGAVCSGIRNALGFDRVAVNLADGKGSLSSRAAAGFDVGDPMTSFNFGVDVARRLFRPAYEVEGCYLLPREAAEAIAPADPHRYRSTMNGTGPHAWRNHWLLVPLVDRAGEPIGLIWVDEPIDRLLPGRERLQALRLFANQTSTALECVRQFEQMRELAERDPLTRLLNRRSFFERLGDELRRCRAQRRPLALVFGDLDGFKQLNDSQGHVAGDLALQRFAEALNDAAAPADCFRIGGDEFAVILPGASADDVLEVLARLRRASERLRFGAATVRASFGIAVVEDGDSDSARLLRAADDAMYEAKRAGDVFRIAA
jgi:diguanylate cyclase (GGDEF)-like protein